jgi:GDP-4-dehydro-6-deoxy-D-mannose reductase
MSTWLITGATGFLGRHALDVLGEGLDEAGRADATVLVMGRRLPPGWREDRFVAADLEEPEQVRRAIEQVRPDHVIHTAGRTPPAPDEALYRLNFWATIRLLNALRALGRPVRVTLAGSAAELGPVPASVLPVSEDQPCSPVEPYGRSKWMASVAGLAERPPLEVNVARVFNPIGPGQPANQAFGDFAAQLRSNAGDPLVLVTGGLDARRDFVDVRDAARALVAVALRGRAGRVYHVGTGHSRTVLEGLERLIALSGRTVSLCEDPARRSRKGPSDSRADIGRIRAETGWSPRIDFERSLADLWEEVASRPVERSGSAPGRLPLTA